jgi:hypothetical protein
MFTLWFEGLVWVIDEINPGIYNNTYTSEILSKALDNDSCMIKLSRWLMW